MTATQRYESLDIDDARLCGWREMDCKSFSALRSLQPSLIILARIIRHVALKTLTADSYGDEETQINQARSRLVHGLRGHRSRESALSGQRQGQDRTLPSRPVRS